MQFLMHHVSVRLNDDIAGICINVRSSVILLVSYHNLVTAAISDLDGALFHTES